MWQWALCAHACRTADSAWLFGAAFPAQECGCWVYGVYRFAMCEVLETSWDSLGAVVPTSKESPSAWTAFCLCCVMQCNVQLQHMVWYYSVGSLLHVCCVLHSFKIALFICAVMCLKLTMAMFRRQFIGCRHFKDSRCPDRACSVKGLYLCGIFVAGQLLGSVAAQAQSVEWSGPVVRNQLLLANCNTVELCPQFLTEPMRFKVGQLLQSSSLFPAHVHQPPALCKSCLQISRVHNHQQQLLLSRNRLAAPGIGPQHCAEAITEGGQSVAMVCAQQWLTHRIGLDPSDTGQIRHALPHKLLRPEAITASAVKFKSRPSKGKQSDELTIEDMLQDEQKERHHNVHSMLQHVGASLHDLRYRMR